MRDAPLVEDRAKAQLNRCLDEGTVIYSRHFKDELANDDLTTEDILAVCRSGAIVMAPEKTSRPASGSTGSKGSPPIIVK